MKCQQRSAFGQSAKLVSLWKGVSVKVERDRKTEEEGRQVDIYTHTHTHIYIYIYIYIYIHVPGSITPLLKVLPANEISQADTVLAELMEAG